MNAHVSGLFIYPVKSCRGVSLGEVELGRWGFRHDREFLVTDESYNFLTQRNAPELATVEIGVEDEWLVLKTANTEGFRVPLEVLPTSDNARGPMPVTIFRDHVLADDAGNEAAEWFSTVLQRRCRLVRIGASYSRKVPPEEIAPARRAGLAPDISFTDAFPILLAAEESLADLNTRLPAAIPMSRFRANIVVRGAEAYAENNWGDVAIGEISFTGAAACLRCVVTTTDQQTGRRDGPEPLRTLATYRRSSDGSGVMFGQYLVHHANGRLRIGDTLKINGQSRAASAANQT
jgi:uncharacterized protein YcbX